MSFSYSSSLLTIKFHVSIEHQDFRFAIMMQCNFKGPEEVKRERSARISSQVLNNIRIANT